MPIRVKCPQCGSVVRVAEKYAGRNVNCPGCKGPIEVPDAKAQDSGMDPRSTSNQTTRPGGNDAGESRGVASSPPVVVANSQPGMLMWAVSSFLNLVAMLLVVLSVVIFFFLRAHAPDNVAIALTGGWVFKEEVYYIGMALASLFSIIGVGHLYRAYGSKQDNPKAVPAGPMVMSNRPWARIAMLGGAIVALWVVVAVVTPVLTHKNPAGNGAQQAPVGGAQPPVVGAAQGPAGPGAWNVSVRINRDTTSYTVALTDAWYLNDGHKAGMKKTLCVALSFKNLGPREEAFSLFGDRRPAGEAGVVNDVEIKTDKGRLYPGTEWFADGSPTWEARALGLRGSTDKSRKHDMTAAWSWHLTKKIDEMGQSAVFFQIPEDEKPAELICRPRHPELNRQAPLQSWTLPQIDFDVRLYSKAFGFLPATDEVIDALVKALNDPEVFVRIEAAKVLGRFGPQAKNAVEPLKSMVDDSNRKHDGKGDQMRVSKRTDGLQDFLNALQQIDPAEFATVEKMFQERHDQERQDREDSQAATKREAEERREAARKDQEANQRERKHEATLVWRDKGSSARFRIEVKDDEITVKFLDGDRLLAGLSGTLNRTSTKATAFKGTLKVTFSDEKSKEYAIRATVNLIGQDQLELSLENWPRSSQGKKISTPRSMNRTLVHQHPSPNSPSGSSVRTPTSRRSP